MIDVGHDMVSVAGNETKYIYEVEHGGLKWNRVKEVLVPKGVEQCCIKRSALGWAGARGKGLGLSRRPARRANRCQREIPMTLLIGRYPRKGTLFEIGVANISELL